MPPQRVVMAIDPGRRRCGVAVCDAAGIRARAVVPPEQLPDLVADWQGRYSVTEVVMGNRTGSEGLMRALSGTVTVPLAAVDEHGSTLRARRRYFHEHPPRGWRRLIPRSLLVPPEPYDDYVAILLAEAALAAGERDGVH
jgi:RNase H-fold protein (predicted Holliday junction resolvase)